MSGINKEFIQRKLINEVIAERLYQDAKHPHPGGFPISDRLAILIEEVGEVGKAICEHNPVEVRDELVEVCATALRWLELMDSEIIEEIERMQELGISPEINEALLYQYATGSLKRRRSVPDDSGC